MVVGVSGDGDLGRRRPGADHRGVETCDAVHGRSEVGQGLAVDSQNRDPAVVPEGSRGGGPVCHGPHQPETAAPNPGLAHVQRRTGGVGQVDASGGTGSHDACGDPRKAGGVDVRGDLLDVPSADVQGHRASPDVQGQGGPCCGLPGGGGGQGVAPGGGAVGDGGGGVVRPTVVQVHSHLGGLVGDVGFREGDVPRHEVPSVRGGHGEVGEEVHVIGRPGGEGHVSPGPVGGDGFAPRQVVAVGLGCRGDGPFVRPDAQDRVEVGPRPPAAHVYPRDDAVGQGVVEAGHHGNPVGDPEVVGPRSQDVGGGRGLDGGPDGGGGGDGCPLVVPDPPEGGFPGLQPPDPLHQVQGGHGGEARARPVARGVVLMGSVLEGEDVALLDLFLSFPKDAEGSPGSPWR